MDRVANFHAIEIYLNEIWNCIGRAEEFDFMPHDVKHAATPDPRSLFFVDEAHGNVHRHHRIPSNAKKIHVHRETANRVKLILARQHADLLTVNVNGADGRHEAAGVNALVDVLVGHGNRERGLLLTVNDGGNFAAAAECSG